MLKEWELLKMF